MSTDEYVPSEARVCIDYCNAAITRKGPGGEKVTMEEADRAFDRFLTRVRRDAARSALIEFRRTELAIIPPDAEEDDPIRTRQQALAWRIEMHLLGNHPEEVSP